nr:copia protein [Tanacetum cinerariifolium]
MQNKSVLLLSIQTLNVWMTMLKTEKLVDIILFIVDSGCSKYMAGNLKLLINFVEKFLGTVKYGNDQIAPILGYRDLVQGAVTIKRVYYVEGLNHNLFSVGQFCDADLEVAFRKSTCYIRDLKGNDLLIGLSKEDFMLNSDPVPQCQSTALEHDRLSPSPQYQENVPQADRTVITSNELDLLFSPMFDELLNGSSHVVSKSSAESTADAPNHLPSQAPTVSSTENINQAEMIAENAQVENDEFINIFCTPVQDRGETSSRHVDSSNMHTFYQRHPSEHRWMKDHPLEQVIGNPSQSVRTRRQLESDGEMCMFALTVSQTKPKNNKEAMADSAWIESMQEELHQFDRLDVWGLVDRPLCKNVINMKWLWKNKHDEENTVIRNKSHLVAKGYAQKEGVDFEESLHQLLGWKLFGCSLHMLHTNHSLFTKQSIGTPMATKHLDADLSGTSVDQTKYRIMVGALMYLIASRPDIVHATCYCARYQAKPTEKHLTAGKRIFRYLKDTIHMGLWYPKDIGFELTAFSDSDHAGCLDSRKSTSDGIQFLGGDNLVSWLSKKQDCTSMSFVEAEYVSLSACCAQVLWMRTQLTDYGFHFDKIPMYCDSKEAIAISCNPIQHSFTKHIVVRYHFIKEKVEKGIVELFFVGTEYQLADLFNKALPEERFNEDGNLARANIKQALGRSYALSWKPCQGDSLNLPDHSQIIPKDKTGLGYDSQLNERDLNNKSDVFESESNSSVNKSEEDNNQANDMYKAGERYHAVPSLYTRNFMPPRHDDVKILK